MKLSLAFALASFALPCIALPATSTDTASAEAVTCTGSWSAVTSKDYIAALNPGWNLGNTLDAVEDEGDWNNPAVQEVTFDDVKSAGFKSVRLPVTWAYHFTSESPDWTVDPAWLDRVSQVVGFATARGLRTIVNVHHDSWIWADLTTTSDYTLIEEKFYRLWYQIATKLACTTELVSFEPINEPRSSTEAQAAELNKLNTIFLQAIKDAGGWNPDRVVTLVGPNEDSIQTSLYFEPPSSNFTNPWAIQFHYYSPYDFIFGAWGKTIWGSDADKATLEADFANIRGNFTDVPLVIGEWAASAGSTETAARRKYFDFLVKSATKYDISTVIWDNGADFLDRSAHTWRDQTAIDSYLNAAKGVSNTLADSTVDAAATSQSSSAYIFHKVGTSVVDQTLPFILNGNTLSGIKLGSTSLVSGTDYTASGSNIVFLSSFLSKQGLNTNDAAGVKGTLTLTFSAGAAVTVDLVQYTLPVLASTSQAAVAATQISIPVTWNGVPKVAAVKALTTTGVYLVDDWTVYLGPLQQARTTYGNQWSFDASNVILTSSAVDAVIAKGVNTVFTVEFFPRVEGNSVNVTVTV